MVIPQKPALRDVIEAHLLYQLYLCTNTYKLYIYIMVIFTQGRIAGYLDPWYHY